jgi:hypothetical protein
MRLTLPTATLLFAALTVGLPPRAARSQEHAQVLQGLGPRFIVFREKVQDEIGLSAEQKSNVNARAFDFVQETMEFFQSLQNTNADERPKKLGEYAQKANEKIEALLKRNLKDEQLKRLKEIGLQAEGLFAIGHPEVSKELKITDEQRIQFMEVMQSFQKQVEPLAKEMQQQGGDHKEFAKKVQTLRDEHQIEIRAFLTDDQKTQWKEMQGKPFKLED